MSVFDTDGRAGLRWADSCRDGNEHFQIITPCSGMPVLYKLNHENSPARANEKESVLNISASIINLLEELDLNESVFEEKNFYGRADALEQLDFHGSHRMKQIMERGFGKEKQNERRTSLEGLKKMLLEIDRNMFLSLQEKIRCGEWTFFNFRKSLLAYTGPLEEDEGDAWYDNLDLLINGLLGDRPVPEAINEPEAEMIFYQKIPARVVFKMAEWTGCNDCDIFFDIGSGLGQATMLMQLLTGMESKGIEFEPAYYQYAVDCVNDLQLPGVSFINENALTTDLTGAAVFFMYSPFEGEMLKKMLERLKRLSLNRRIQLFTYGPCTPAVGGQSWLRNLHGDRFDALHLCHFESL